MWLTMGREDVESILAETNDWLSANQISIELTKKNKHVSQTSLSFVLRRMHKGKIILRKRKETEYHTYEYKLDKEFFEDND